MQDAAKLEMVGRIFRQYGGKIKARVRWGVHMRGIQTIHKEAVVCGQH